MLAMLACLAACDGAGAASRPVAAPVPAGRYLLQQVDGDPVPVSLPAPQPWEPAVVVERDTLDVSASGAVIWHLTLRPAAGADAVRVTETGVLRVTPDEAGAVVYVDREPPYPARFPIGEARMAGTELELQVLPPWSGSTMYRFRFTRLR
jgi:hypothetical protein